MKNKLLFLAMGLALSTQMILAQVPSYLPTNGLVGYWPFNGNANDLSGNNINGTNHGVVLTNDRNGVSSSAYEFFGSSWIECAYNSKLNVGAESFSISCWATKSGGNMYQHMVTRNEISTWPNAIGSYALRYHTPGISFFGSGNLTVNNSNVTTSAISSLDKWNHFVGVFNVSSGVMSIYVNGVLSISSPIPTTVQSFNNNGGLFFGVEHPTVSLPSGPQFLTGKLDDIGIWNRALTQDEITSLYYAENTCQSLVINTGVLSFNPPTYQNTVTIYPNPANDQITIDCGTLANVTGWKVKISNALGQEVFTGAMNTQQHVVPLNSWGGQGIYFVKIYDASNNLMNTKKIILQ